MTEHNVSLALALLQNHPRVAASIFEQTSVNEVASFLTHLSDGDEGDVLQYVMPSYMARLCKALPNSMAIKLLSPLEESQIAIILRYLDKAHRELILSETPKKRANTIQLLLKFSQATVGAWLTPQVAVTTPESTLAQTLDTLSENDALAETNCVFIINRNQQYQGRLYYLDILKNQSNHLVSQYMKPDKITLTANMSINTAYENDAWYQYDTLPVLNQNKHFIGILEYRHLRNALSHLKNQTSKNKKNPGLTGVGEVYGSTLMSVFQTMSQVVQSDLHQ